MEGDVGCEKVLQSALCGRVVGKWYGAYEGSTGRGKKNGTQSVRVEVQREDSSPSSAITSLNEFGPITSEPLACIVLFLITWLSWSCPKALPFSEL